MKLRFVESRQPFDGEYVIASVRIDLYGKPYIVFKCENSPYMWSDDSKDRYIKYYNTIEDAKKDINNADQCVVKM